MIQADLSAVARRAARTRSNDRRVDLSDPRDGVATIRATHRAEDALAIRNRLAALARAMRSDGDPRSIDTLMADLHYQAVLGTTPEVGDLDTAPRCWPADMDEPGPRGSDPDPTDLSVPEPHESPTPEPPTAHQLGGLPVPPKRVEMQIVMTLSALLGLDDTPAELRGYGAIDPDTAREIANHADEAVLRRLFCDPVDGRLVAMEAGTRCFTGSLRQFVLSRDQVDRLTGAPIRDIDHVLEWLNGGSTTAANAQSLARSTHVIRDHPGVRAEALPEADAWRANAPVIRWTLPTGHTHDNRPPPSLGWGSHPPDRPPPPPTAEWSRLEECFHFATWRSILDKRRRERRNHPWLWDHGRRHRGPIA